MHPPQDLYINESYHIPVQLLEMRAVRSSGPGGVGLDCPGWQGLLDGWVDVLACV